MKKVALIIAAAIGCTISLSAQTNIFPTAGNVGIGTITPSTLFQVNGGTSQFGGSVNFARFASDGDLTFSGTGDHLVAGNKYVFRYASNQNAGLYFNSSNSRYEFRDVSAAPISWFVLTTGASYFKGNMAIGSTIAPLARLDITPSSAAAIKINPFSAATGSTGELRMMELTANGTNFVGFKSPDNISSNRVWVLPATDGTANQLLKTNGAGVLSWATDANTIYSAGTGINITGTTITNISPDQVVAITGSGATSISGTYPNFTISSTDNNTTYTAGTGLTLTGTTFDNAAPDQIVTLIGAGGTTISGTYPNFTISSTTGGGSGWLLAGNAGTLDGTDFIGTTDNAPLNFRVNNQKAGRIEDILANTFFGYLSGNSNTTGQQNTATGHIALSFNTIGQLNTATGQSALYFNTIGNQNTATGAEALTYNTNGGVNTATGTSALYYNNGNFNSATGGRSLYNNTTGDNNVADGYEALYVNTTGSNNTALGFQSGYNCAGGGNVFLGYYAGYNETGSNKLYIANNSSNPPLIFGDFVEGKLGLGTTTPAANVDIIGTIKITDGTQGLNKVLMSDSTGLASWQTLAANDWSLTGSVAAADGSNFIGTLNDAPLYFKVNNENAGKIDKFMQNTFFGYLTGNSITAGNGNTAIGSSALKMNTTGNDNNAIGDFAMYSNTLGAGNVAIGVSALFNNLSGNNNLANGHSALSSNTTGSNNIANGNNALYSNIDGEGNIANGVNALFSNTSGTYNIANGYNALYANTTGSFNVANGYEALATNSTGSNNTANGVNSLFSNTTGSWNSATGANTLYSNTSGDYNTASGHNALYYNTTGVYNTATGYHALQGNTTGFENTAVGGDALGGNTTGQLNTTVGFAAQSYNTSGNNNTAIGGVALLWNVAGNNATAVGFGAMKYTNQTTTSYTNYSVAVGFEALRGAFSISNTGNNNVAIGYQALWSYTTGSFNTANGTQSLFSNTDGSNNTATGHQSLNLNTIGYENTAVGSYALFSNTTGRFNTASGYHALYTNISGIFNTAFGWGADVSTNALSNATAIGNSALVDANDKVRIGNSSVSSNGGQVSWSTYSDERIKDHVQENVPGLAFISQLRPVTYHYNVSKQNQIEGISDTAQWDTKYAIEKMQFTGFIAQEVDAAAQKINYDFSGVDKSGALMSLRYSDFVVPLVQATQELDSVNLDQNEQIVGLSNTIKEQQAAIATLQQQINEMNAVMLNSTMNYGTIEVSIPEAIQQPLLGQNIPNPFESNTIIPFRIPKNCADASILFAEISTGRIVRVIPVSCGETQLSIDAGMLSSGTYSYSLIVDGELVATRQMVIQD